ncbi:2-oxoglutarate--ferredoxin oxidoreductase beta subunit [Sphingomonas changbaiensis NBRC 104936]|uniref:2-oxoglutarate--ferredoxin oxidoreductase beta subunit n=1 Tax=Sphingomonas changbaiensis NBRC 104936 TaxID=1219043 RepID=A0A0E9MQ65_9SPHN|nr:2-oxoacid:ferredoxin oxidoreductase subunit beta [Sphingomonas changbaiensis]GAO39694.1 2-oxoglutarate--ferredoxin oxidoreductase beta subunit [Sphingomonas changbaiensis NBRC 104936]
MNDMTPVAKTTTIKDWESDQEVRWCPGCGDYAILKAVQRTMPEIGATPEKTVFVSGIGCSSRFPYYMETYGFHTIHGRAPAIATGVKLANPELDVWIITGDGDALSIGGNHTMHILRRNLDCQILLFNNEIYGLTKGQYSPTSRVGTRSPSTPFGSVDRPASPCSFALGSGARFVARGIDVHKNLAAVLKAAHAHKGASFVEIYQNCIVYNDEVFAAFTEKAKAQVNQIWLENGEPMLFAGGTMGLKLNAKELRLEIVNVENGNWEAAGVIRHDQTNKGIAQMLIDMEIENGFPVALGVIFNHPRPTFERAVTDQNRAAAEGKTPDLQKLVAKGQTWQVEKQPHEI